MEAGTSYVKEASGALGSVRRTQARLQGRVTAEGVEDAGESEGRPVMGRIILTQILYKTLVDLFMMSYMISTC
jgi:hypothetical protein